MRRALTRARTATVIAIALGPGCTDRVAEDMEQALWSTNDAIAWSLLASESAAWADETDPRWPFVLGDPAAYVRHAAAGACPALDREPEEGFPFALEAGYFGCVSGSRLLATTSAGRLHISGTADVVEATYDDLFLGSVRAPRGTLTGARDLGVEVYELVGVLHLPAAAQLRESTAEFHLTVDHRVGPQVSFDGVVVLDPEGEAVRVALRDVVVELDDIPGECPLPHAGVVTVGDRPEVVVDVRAADDRGRVVVTRRARESTGTRLCAFASDVL